MMRYRVPHIITGVILAVWASSAQATPCLFDKSDVLAGFTPLDAMAFVDLPDPEIVRATQVLETHFVSQMVAEEAPRVTKSWCMIGMQSAVIAFDVPVEDDAIKSILTRAVYEWTTTTDPVGWQITAIGERGICARGDDPLAPLCP